MIKNKNLNLIALILILFISIGFAYLTSSLVINGLIGYKGNTWNIYFDNISMIENDVNGSKPTINNSKDTVDFSITFSEPGEVYKFSVDVVNDGTIDAMLSEILTTGIDSSNSSYLSYTVKYYDDTELSVNDGIKAGTKTRLNVEVNYKYDTEELAPTGSQNFSIKLTYVQARDNANFKNDLIKPDNNNVFTLNNVKSNSLNNLKIYGNTEQTTYTGQNLFNRDDRSDVSNLVTYLDDDWVTISYDNSSGTSNKLINFFTNNLDISIDTNYRIVFEVKNVSGNCIFYLTSIWNKSETEIKGQFSTKSYNLADLENGYFEAYTAKSRNIENTQDGLRTYLLLAPGESGSITFRISVLKDLNVTEDNFIYEPYVGGEAAPNPNYPQEVNSVTGDSSFKIVGKNLFSKDNALLGYEINGTVNGYGKIVSSTNWYTSEFIRIKPNTEYTLSCQGKTEGRAIPFYDKNFNYISGVTLLVGSFVTPANAYYVRINGLISQIDNVQLEEGDTATDYEPYQEHVYPISLGSLELSKIDNYQDSLYYEDGDWYLEKKIGMYTITGSETYEWYPDNPRICFNFGNIPPNNDKYPSNTTDMPLVMSNKYVTITINDLHYVTYENRKNGFTLSNNNYISFRRKKWTSKDTAVSESTGTKIYYVYRNPVKEKITDSTLLSQLNAIKNNNLFSGTNHIYFDSNIGTDISFDYIEE